MSRSTPTTGRWIPGGEGLLRRRRLPSPSPGCPGRAVRSGAEALPESWAGELGPGGAGWHQDSHQCQQAKAMSHERATAQGRNHRGPGGRALSQGQRLSWKWKQLPPGPIKGKNRPQLLSSMLRRPRRVATKSSRCARKRADDAQKIAHKRDPAEIPHDQLPKDAAGKPEPQAQPNFTNTYSYILKRADGWIQGYYCKAAVDGEHQVNPNKRVSGVLMTSIWWPSTGRNCKWSPAATPGRSRPRYYCFWAPAG